MSRRARRLLAMVLVAAAAGSAGYLFNNLREQEKSQELASRQLMALDLPDLEGKSQPMSQWKGAILVVNFWATWCQPCRDEMPAFSRLQKRFASQGVQFVGIGIDSAEKMRAFAAEVPVSYPLLVGNTALLGVTSALGNHAGGLPHTVILDRQGTLRESKLGIWEEEDLAAVLSGLGS